MRRVRYAPVSREDSLARVKAVGGKGWGQVRMQLQKKAPPKGSEFDDIPLESVNDEQVCVYVFKRSKGCGSSYKHIYVHM